MQPSQKHGVPQLPLPAAPPAPSSTNGSDGGWQSVDAAAPADPWSGAAGTVSSSPPCGGVAVMPRGGSSTAGTTPAATAPIEQGGWLMPDSSTAAAAGVLVLGSPAAAASPVRSAGSIEGSVSEPSEAPRPFGRRSSAVRRARSEELPCGFISVSIQPHEDAMAATRQQAIHEQLLRAAVAEGGNAGGGRGGGRSHQGGGMEGGRWPWWRPRGWCSSAGVRPAHAHALGEGGVCFLAGLLHGHKGGAFGRCWRASRAPNSPDTPALPASTLLTGALWALVKRDLAPLVMLAAVLLALQAPAAAPRSPFITQAQLEQQLSYPLLPKGSHLWRRAAPAAALLPPAAVLAALVVRQRWPARRAWAACAASLLAAALAAAALAGAMTALAPRPRPAFRDLCWPDGHPAWSPNPPGKAGHAGSAAAGAAPAAGAQPSGAATLGDAGGGYPLCSCSPQQERYALSSFPAAIVAVVAAGWGYLSAVLLLLLMPSAGVAAQGAQTAPAGAEEGDVAATSAAPRLHGSYLEHHARGVSAGSAAAAEAGAAVTRRQERAQLLAPAGAAEREEQAQLLVPLLALGSAHAPAPLPHTGAGSGGCAHPAVSAWRLLLALLPAAAAVLLGVQQAGARIYHRTDVVGGLLLGLSLGGAFAWQATG